MELIRRTFNPARWNGSDSAVTIGNFDGLHLGHQTLIERTLAVAASERLTPTAIIFEPHPREYFSPREAPPRVFSLREKLCALQRAGIQRAFCLRFDARLAALSAEDFIRRILVAGLGTRAVVVGEDFRFGTDRRGDAAMLRRHGAVAGFSVDCLGAVTEHAARISSTRLRAALAEPDLALTRRLLGRPYCMQGRVRPGLKLGRKLGMPTANIHRLQPTALRHGVYAVRADWDWRHGVTGVASLGVRPTLGLSACLLETHLFGEAPDLYGKSLEVEFVAFLRPQLRFDSLDDLGRQMQMDAGQAKTLLGCPA